MTDALIDTASLRQALSEVDAEVQAAEVAKKKAEQLRGMLAIAEALPMSWAQRDPGKSGANYRLLGQDGYPVIVRELLPEGISQFTGTQHQWQRHTEELGYYRSLDVVPPNAPLVSLAEVRMCPCPNCGTDRPLIQSYHQIYDSPEGDEWEKKELVLCCEEVRIIDSQARPNRF